jgi:VanZ family protein
MDGLFMKSPRSRITLFRIALATALSGITILATSPLSFPVAADVNDKLNHVLAFLVLAWLADASFPEKKFPLGLILPLFAYGLAIEIIQYFLPFRMFSWYDVAADVLGIGFYKTFRFFVPTAPMSAPLKKKL